MKRALLLLLVASPAWADDWLMSSPRTRMMGPDGATPIANPPLGEDSDAVEGWDLPHDDAVLLVQRGVLDGGCEGWIADERRVFAQVLHDDAGATMKYELGGGKSTMIVSGTQSENGTWVAGAIYATCAGRESFVITATAHHAANKPAVERMRAIATKAGKSLEVHGKAPATWEISFGNHALDVPAPTYPKKRSAPGMTMFSVPGMASLATLPESYTGDCAVYLEQVQKNYTAEQAKQPVDDRFQTVLVERTGDIVWRIAKQHAAKGMHTDQWYANITASTCKPGIAGSVLAISFDGATTKSELPPAVVTRLRRILAAAIASLR